MEKFDTTVIEIGDQRLAVAVAATTEERQQGLRNVEALPHAVDGMLFVFEETRSARFVMEDTLIPLDIWWFDGDGILIGVTAMTPCSVDPCATYASPAPVGSALETPQGVYEFEVGDQYSLGDIP